MPSGPKLTPELIRHYDDVRKYFLQHPIPDCVPLFLNSFGEDGGLGVYQLVEDVLRLFNPVDVVPHLNISLRSTHVGVRYWSAQTAALFPVPELIEPLATLLQDPNADIRYTAVMALEQIKDNKILQILNQALIHESEQDVRELISEILRKK
jgi:hypothetical protein